MQRQQLMDFNQRMSVAGEGRRGRGGGGGGPVVAAVANATFTMAVAAALLGLSTAASDNDDYDELGLIGFSSLLSTAASAASFNNTTTTTTTSVGYDNSTTMAGSGEDDFVLPYSYPEMVLIAIVAGFLSLLTVAGNFMVMISFKIDKQLQTISNYFLFSLAVADFAIGLISMPLFTVYILAGRWQLGPYVCDTWLSLDYLASNASVLNLLIISFDRYFSVTRPLTYRARRTPRRAGIMIAAAWLISLVMWPPWIYAWPYIEGNRSVPPDKCYIQFIETNDYITFGTAIAAFYAPVTVMCVLYWRVWRTTENRQKDLSNLQAGKKNDSHRSNSSAEEQTVLMNDGDYHGRGDWRRSRNSESGGPLGDDMETSYVPSSAYLSGHHRGRYGSWKTWAYWRRWLRWSTWQQWARHLTRRNNQQQQQQRRRVRQGATEYTTTDLYSEGSNAVTTPASAETPLASSVSRGTSLNVIRDPYSSTPVRYKAAAAASSSAASVAAGSADAGRRRSNLAPSRSLTSKDNMEDEDRQSVMDGVGPGDATTPEAARRSHSADSVFTILIRLPAENSRLSDSDSKAEHKVSIRMIPIPSPASHQQRRANAAASAAGGGNQPAVRSRSVPVCTDEHYGSGAAGGGGGGGNRSASHYTSNRSLAAGRATFNDTDNSLLCGTNLHLPSALSLSKLTKPNSLPLGGKGKMKSHQQVASPWVPRSCMPVAQSPLIVRCNRFNGGPSTGGDSETKVLPVGERRGGGGGGVGGRGAAGQALPTVSGSVASGGGNSLHPPVRRNHPYSPSAAAAAAATAAANKKANKKPKKKNQEKRQERKAAKTLSAILLAFILTWTPYNVLTLLKALAPCSDNDCFSSELWNFSYYLCYINSTINPVCYALCNASFRRTYVRILTCKWHSRTKTAVQRGVYN